jgi:hypothetical protein
MFYGRDTHAESAAALFTLIASWLRNSADRERRDRRTVNMQIAAS